MTNVFAVVVLTLLAAVPAIAQTPTPPSPLEPVIVTSGEGIVKLAVIRDLRPAKEQGMSS